MNAATHIVGSSYCRELHRGLVGQCTDNGTHQNHTHSVGYGAGGFQSKDLGLFVKAMCGILELF